MLLKQKNILFIGIYLILFISISAIAYGEAREESGNETKITKIPQEREWLDKAKKLRLPKPDEAIEACTKALELNPACIEAYELRAFIYAGKKEYYLAREDYTKLIEVDSKAADQYYLKRGLVFEEEIQYDNAKDDYSKAIELNPKLKDAYHARAFLFKNKLKKNNEAIGDFTKWIELDLYNTMPYSVRASLYEETGQFELAIKDYSKLLELKPDKALYWYVKQAELYEKISKYDMAIDDYTKAIELGNLGYVYIRRAAVYDKLGKYDLAQADRVKGEAQLKAERNWISEWGFIKPVIIPSTFILCLLISALSTVRYILKKK